MLDDWAERWAASAKGVEIDKSSGGNRNDIPDPHSMIAPPSGWDDGKSGWKMVTPTMAGCMKLTRSRTCLAMKIPVEKVEKVEG